MASIIAIIVVITKDAKRIIPNVMNFKSRCIRLLLTEVKQWHNNVIDININGILTEESATTVAIGPAVMHNASVRIPPTIKLNVKALLTYLLLIFCFWIIADPIPVSERLEKTVVTLTNSA